MSEDLEEIRKQAARYRWIRDHFEWRREGELLDNDSHAFVGCRFPYLANFSCATMLDHNIDKMMAEPGFTGPSIVADPLPVSAPGANFDREESEDA